MKKWWLKIILKIRDRLWFYVRQQYPDDTPESYESDFRVRFCAITISPLLMIIHTLYVICSLIFNLKEGDGNGNDMGEVILGAIILGIIEWYFNKYVLSLLSIYPIDAKHDLGRLKNSLYGASVALSFLLLSIGYIILLNAIRL